MPSQINNSDLCFLLYNYTFSLIVQHSLQEFEPAKIAAKARSASDDYCYGYMNVDTQGYYITTVKLSTGVVDCSAREFGSDEVPMGIVSFDRALKNDGYLGQMNIITVSSFSGPNAAIWGYDIAQVDDLRSEYLFHTPSEIPSKEAPYSIPVYSIDPLLRGTELLFGSVKERNFPIIAGAHVPCAVKSQDSIDTNTGKPTSGWVWCLLSLAISVIRSRDACLFAEDVGFFADEYEYGKMKSLTKGEVISKLNKKQKQVVYSQFLCGFDQNVPYKEVFVGYRYRRVDPGQHGTALTCAPYITLAGNAYPQKGKATRLAEMTASEWKDEVLSKRS